MPKKKNKNPLKKLANTILENAKNAFYLGASNKSNAPVRSSKQNLYKKRLTLWSMKSNFKLN
jgi:hypothetical protein